MTRSVVCQSTWVLPMVMPATAAVAKAGMTMARNTTCFERLPMLALMVRSPEGVAERIEHECGERRTRQKHVHVENKDLPFAGCGRQTDGRVAQYTLKRLSGFSAVGASYDPIGIPSEHLFGIDGVVETQSLFGSYVNAADCRDDVIERGIRAIAVRKLISQDAWRGCTCRLSRLCPGDRALKIVVD